MTVNETIAIVSLIIGLYILGVKEIQRRRDRDREELSRKKDRDCKELEIQAKKDRQAIEAIIDLHLEARMEEYKRGYAEMVQLIRSGTLK